MRFGPFLAIPLLLSACAGPPPRSAPAESIRANILKHGVADRIVLRAENRLPLRAAELIAPDGKITKARAIVVSPATELGENRLLGGSLLSTGSFGVAAVPASPAALGGGVEGRSELFLMRSTASITIPDRVAYRRQWRHYRVRLIFGDPPALEKREIKAPPPLPG